jgi:hypothetical protein
MSKVQRDLAFASLRVMERDLRFNICDMKSSYLPNSENITFPLICPIPVLDGTRTNNTL